MGVVPQLRNEFERDFENFLLMGTSVFSVYYVHDLDHGWIFSCILF